MIRLDLGLLLEFHTAKSDHTCHGDEAGCSPGNWKLPGDLALFFWFSLGRNEIQPAHQSLLSRTERISGLLRQIAGFRSVYCGHCGNQVGGNLLILEEMRMA